LGSGTAAHAALEALRLGDPQAEILMIAEEMSLPRIDVDEREEALDTANGQLDAMLNEVFNEWRRQLSSGLDESSEGVTLVKATNRMRVDVEDRAITFNDGTKIKYKKCLLATAGKPREFYVLDKDKIRISMKDQINTLHSSLDFRNLARCAPPRAAARARAHADDRLASSPDARHVTVVGGGFLGTEVVAALAAAGTCGVTHVMGEPSVLAQYLPDYLSAYVTSRLVRLGVDVREEALVTGVRPGALRTRKGSKPGEETLSVTLVGAERVSLDTDCVILASTSVQPDLMGLDDPSSGLEVNDGGLCTNASLEAFNGLFVAGQCPVRCSRTNLRRSLAAWPPGRQRRNLLRPHDRPQEGGHVRPRGELGDVGGAQHDGGRGPRGPLFAPALVQVQPARHRLGVPRRGQDRRQARGARAGAAAAGD
jgi:programmed cell death 8 (apoptosis-inducing factor)